MGLEACFLDATPELINLANHTYIRHASVPKHILDKQWDSGSQSHVGVRLLQPYVDKTLIPVFVKRDC
jgi:hypothetical protein